VSLDPTDTYVLSLSPSSLYQYNLRDGQLVATLPVPKHMGGDNVVDIDVARFTVFAISDLKPNLCAIGTDDGRIYIHDIANPSNQPPLMAQRHGGAVTGLAYSSVHPNVLFSCGRDGVILVHHTSEGTSQTLVGAGAEASILSMSLHANGTTCAVGCDSGDVLVYDFRIHNEAAELSASLLASFRSNEPIHSLFFAPPPRSKDKLRQSSSSSSTKVSNKENSGARPPPSSTTTAAAPKTPVSPTRRSLATKLAALRSSASPKRTRGGSPPKAPSPSSPLHNYNRIRPRSPALASENTNVSGMGGI
jgi:WD40 repeat protein